MNWKDLKVGGKLAIGFGLLILISIILGSLAVSNMSDISNRSTDLAKEYIPEVEVSNAIERNARETMYNMRGYGLTQEQSYLNEGQNAMSQLDAEINKARELEKNATELVKLEGNIDDVQSNLDQYKNLVDKTITVNNTITQAGTQMDEAANNFMDACYQYLESQNDQYQSEINEDAGQNALAERHDKITWINNIIDEGNALRVANFKAQSRRAPSTLNNALDEFDISGYLSDIREITYLSEDTRALNTIEKAGQNYTEAVRNYLNAWQERENLNQERDKVATNVLQATQVVSEAGVENTSNIANQAVTKLSQASTVMIIGLILAVIIGIILAMAITRAITSPLNKGVIFAREIADGNLQATVDVDQKDEIGVLADALRSMANKLKEIVTEIKKGANNIASASQQVSSSSQQMSQGSNEQASAAEEVSSSMEEMTSNIQQNSDNSKETEQIAKKATEGIKEGNQATQTSVKSMQEIAEKISIINDIAYQTNILALNAAVEAARAGEYGRGFSVVASEIRKLAERSSEAAKEIDETSRSGVEISKKAGDKLNEIVPEIEKTSRLVQEITASTNEMNNGASQVNSSVQQLNQVTQQNASSSEELATNAEELSSQADQLKQLVSFFKVGEEGTSQFSEQNKNYSVNINHTGQQGTQSNYAHQNQPQTGTSQQNKPVPEAKNNQGADLSLHNKNTESDENFEQY